MALSPKNHPLYRFRHGIVILWIGAFVAFHMAWTGHDSIAFTLNGFDLAEQIRFHPAIMAESPALRTSIFLWFVIPMVGLGLVMGSSLYENAAIRWILRGVGLAMCLRLNPPEWAFRNPSGIPSDDYAMTLTTMTAVGLGLGVFAIMFSRWILPRLVWFQIGVCALAIVIPLVGLNRALQLLHELQLKTSLGGGAVIYFLIVLGIAVLCGRAVQTTPARKLKPSLQTR